jgi:hypothetical protein
VHLQVQRVVYHVFSSPGRVLPSLGVRRPSVVRPSSVRRPSLTFKKIFSSETTEPNILKLGRNNLWHILYKRSSICSGRMKNMAAVTKNRT